MSKNVDLTSKEWCDLVFEGKNKAFGGWNLAGIPFLIPIRKGLPLA